MHEFIEAFRFIAHNGAVSGQPGLPSLTHLALETLRVGAIGVAISVVIAIPLGVWLGHIHRGSFLAINLGNIGRALPSLAVLAIGDAFLGLGLTVVELALVILAVPPIVTNAYLGVDGVDRDLVDAARGMGMSGWEILRRVELPLAVPLVFAGIRTAAVFVVSTTTIASLAGFSGSLGDVIANETSYHFSGVLGAAICVAALALAVEGALALAQRALTPRGLREAAVQRASATAAGVAVA
jgi:osmoprotectant transport system permease protein